MSGQQRARIGQPKIQGFLARNASILVLLYQRRRRETFVLHYRYADSAGNAVCELTVGSRFTGRFYPSRCDLSPDGRHFVYFVMGGRQEGADEQHVCWTAMCRPPALKASFLLPHYDTWGGGGIFINDRTLQVEAGMHDRKDDLEHLHRSMVDGVRVSIDSRYVPLAASPRVPKQADDGWRPKVQLLQAIARKPSHKSGGDAKLIRRRREAEPPPGDFDRWEYVLRDKVSKQTILDDKVARASWADFDRLGRLMLGIGHAVEIYNSPCGNITAQPDLVLDLEAATEPS